MHHFVWVLAETILGKSSDYDCPSECLAGLMEEQQINVGGEWDELCRIAVVESLYPLLVTVH